MPETAVGSPANLGSYWAVLAQAIDQEHQAYIGAARSANEHAIRCGEARPCAVRLNGERTHDRCVGVCYLKGVDISAEMVRRGVARDCPRFSSGGYRILEAQAAANGAMIGRSYRLPDTARAGDRAGVTAMPRNQRALRRLRRCSRAQLQSRNKCELLHTGDSQDPVFLRGVGNHIMRGRHDNPSQVASVSDNTVDVLSCPEFGFRCLFS
jgi:hypothetical protein